MGINKKYKSNSNHFGIILENVNIHTTSISVCKTLILCLQPWKSKSKILIYGAWLYLILKSIYQ